MSAWMRSRWYLWAFAMRIPLALASQPRLVLLLYTSWLTVVSMRRGGMEGYTTDTDATTFAGRLDGGVLIGQLGASMSSVTHS